MKINVVTAEPASHHVAPEIEIIETTLLPVSRPFMRRRSLANSWWYHGSLTTPLVTGADTLGAFALLEMCLQRGAEPAPHIHQREDETVVVLEGRICYHVGGEVFHAGPGDVVHLPRQVRHHFQLESDYARVLLHLTPAGYENFVRAQAEPARALVVPPVPAQPEAAQLARLAERFGVVLA